MTEIPNWIESRLELDYNKTLPQRAVVEAFIESDRPYLSTTQVHIAIGGPDTASDETVRNRLRELGELEVVESDEVAGGEIFWIADDRSDWPIPKDVEVVRKESHVELSDILERQNLVFLAIGVVLMIPGSLLTVGSVFVIGTSTKVPIVSGETLLFWGVASTLVGLTVLIVAVATWLIELLYTRLNED